MASDKARSFLRCAMIVAFFAPAAVFEARAEGSSPSWSDWLATTLPGGWAPPDHFVYYSPTDLSNWRFGGYGGEFNTNRLAALEFTPWLLNNLPRSFKPAYIATVDATYKAIDFPRWPASLGFDFSISQHFGGQSYSEFAFAPTLNWEWFPWNNFIYTTYRFGPGGVSYDTVDSTLEATTIKARRTERLLNYAVTEVTFSPSKDAKWETFVGVHHRCGIFGLIDGLNGGDTYVYAGFRAGF